MALLIKTNGEEITVSPVDGRKFTLKEYQTFVGGYIEHIRLGTNRHMLLDEEGKLKNKPINELATELGILAGIEYNDYIVGDVLVLSNEEWEME